MWACQQQSIQIRGEQAKEEDERHGGEHRGHSTLSGKTKRKGATRTQHFVRKQHSSAPFDSIMLCPQSAFLGL